MPISFINIVLLALLLASCSGSEEEKLPKIITDGFEMYQKKGADWAINTWGSSWSEEYSSSKNILRNSLIENEKNFGAFKGFDPVKTVAIGKKYQQHYVTLLYEVSPVFAVFTTYQNPKDEWVVMNISWNSEPKEIFPEKIYLR